MKDTLLPIIAGILIVIIPSFFIHWLCNPVEKTPTYSFEPDPVGLWINDGKGTVLHIVNDDTVLHIFNTDTIQLIEYRYIGVKRDTLILSK